MRLLEKRNQLRRDFDGLYECENCEAQEEIKDCYDDRNFHDNVMPNHKCNKCGMSTNSAGFEIERVATKYRDFEHI